MLSFVDRFDQHVGGIFPCRGCNRRHCGGGRARPNIRLMHVFLFHVPPNSDWQGKKVHGNFFIGVQEPKPVFEIMNLFWRTLFGFPIYDLRSPILQAC